MCVNCIVTSRALTRKWSPRVHCFWRDLISHLPGHIAWWVGFKGKHKSVPGEDTIFCLWGQHSIIYRLIRQLGVVPLCFLLADVLPWPVRRNVCGHTRILWFCRSAEKYQVRLWHRIQFSEIWHVLFIKIHFSIFLVSKVVHVIMQDKTLWNQQFGNRVLRPYALEVRRRWPGKTSDGIKDVWARFLAEEDSILVRAAAKKKTRINYAK